VQGAEETVDDSLVQTESRGELSEPHVRTVFSQAKQNADVLSSDLLEAAPPDCRASEFLLRDGLEGKPAED
jgi:hypothetical protein